MQETDQKEDNHLNFQAYSTTVKLSEVILSTLEQFDTQLNQLKHRIVFSKMSRFLKQRTTTDK
jgi:hypothetical protein